MGSLTIERVTPKRTTNNKPYVLVEASGRTLSSWDVGWTNCVGREVPESKLFQDKRGYWNLPDVKDVFPPAVELRTPPAQANGQKPTSIDAKLDEILAILRVHFRT